MRNLRSFASLFLLGLAGCASTPVATVTTPVPPATTPAPIAPSTTPAATIFTQSNSASANAILALAQAADGSLTQSAAIPTGGTGSGGGLENQGSVALNEDGSLLFATNAGSNDFSVFRIVSGVVTLVVRMPSGGTSPISIAVAKGIAYVLNEGSRTGSTDNISGFRFTADGTITAIPNSTRALSAGATAPAQVALSPDASVAVVTERSTSIIDTYALDSTGLAGPILMNQSAGAAPFGFQFLDSSHLFVSEEGTNGVSSYSLAGARTTAITRSARNNQSATCWLAITPSGQFLYTTNTSAGTISAFSIAANGSTALIGSSGNAANATSAPIDAIVSRDGKFLYVVDAGEGVDAFAISAGGGLTRVGNLRTAGSAPNGIVSL